VRAPIEGGSTKPKRKRKPTPKPTPKFVPRQAVDPRTENKRPDRKPAQDPHKKPPAKPKPKPQAEPTPKPRTESPAAALARRRAEQAQRQIERRAEEFRQGAEASARRANIDSMTRGRLQEQQNLERQRELERRARQRELNAADIASDVTSWKDYLFQKAAVVNRLGMYDRLAKQTGDKSFGEAKARDREILAALERKKQDLSNQDATRTAYSSRILKQTGQDVTLAKYANVPGVQGQIKNSTDYNAARRVLEEWLAKAQRGEGIVPNALVARLMRSIDGYAERIVIDRVKLGNEIEKIYNGPGTPEEKRQKINDLLLQNRVLQSQYQALMGRPDGKEGSYNQDYGRYQQYADIFNADMAAKFGMYYAGKRPNDPEMMTRRGLGPVKDQMAVREAWKASGSTLSYGDWLEEQDRATRVTQQQAEAHLRRVVDAMNNGVGKQTGVHYYMGVNPRTGEYGLQEELDYSNPANLVQADLSWAAQNLGMNRGEITTERDRINLVNEALKAWDQRNVQNLSSYGGTGVEALKAEQVDREAYRTRLRLALGLGGQQAVGEGLGTSPIGLIWDLAQAPFSALSQSVKDWAYREGGELFGPKMHWGAMGMDPAEAAALYQEKGILGMIPFIEMRLGLDRSPEAKLRVTRERVEYVQRLNEIDRTARGDAWQKLQAWNDFTANMFSADSDIANVGSMIGFDPLNIIPVSPLQWLKRGARAVAASRGASNVVVGAARGARAFLGANPRDIRADDYMKSLDRKYGEGTIDDLVRNIDQELSNAGDLAGEAAANVGLVNRIMRKVADPALNRFLPEETRRSRPVVRRHVEQEIERLVRERGLDIADTEYARHAEEGRKAKAAEVAAERERRMRRDARENARAQARREAGQEAVGRVKGDLADEVKPKPAASVPPARKPKPAAKPKPEPAAKPKSGADRIAKKNAETLGGLTPPRKTVKGPKPVAQGQPKPKPGPKIGDARPVPRRPGQRYRPTPDLDIDKLRDSVKNRTPQEQARVRQDFGLDDDWKPRGSLDMPPIQYLDDIVAKDEVILRLEPNPKYAEKSVAPPKGTPETDVVGIAAMAQASQIVGKLKKRGALPTAPGAKPPDALPAKAGDKPATKARQDGMSAWAGDAGNAKKQAATENLIGGVRRDARKNGNKRAYVAYALDADDPLLKDPNYWAAVNDATEGATDAIRSAGKLRSLEMRERAWWKKQRDAQDAGAFVSSTEVPRYGGISDTRSVEGRRFAETRDYVRQDTGNVVKAKANPEDPLVSSLERKAVEREEFPEGWHGAGVADTILRTTQGFPELVRHLYAHFTESMPRFGGTGGLGEIVDDLLAKFTIKDFGDLLSDAKRWLTDDNLPVQAGYVVYGRHLFELFHNLRLRKMANDVLEDHPLRAQLTRELAEARKSIDTSGIDADVRAVREEFFKKVPEARGRDGEVADVRRLDPEIQAEVDDFIRQERLFVDTETYVLERAAEDVVRAKYPDAYDILHGVNRARKQSSAALEKAHDAAMARVFKGDPALEDLGAAMWLLMESRSLSDMKWVLPEDAAMELFRRAAEAAGLDPNIAMAQIPAGYRAQGFPTRTRLGPLLEHLDISNLSDDLTRMRHTPQELERLARITPDGQFDTLTDADAAKQVSNILNTKAHVLDLTRQAMGLVRWLGESGRGGWWNAKHAKPRLEDFQVWHGSRQLFQGTNMDDLRVPWHKVPTDSPVHQMIKRASERARVSAEQDFLMKGRRIDPNKVSEVYLWEEYSSFLRNQFGRPDAKTGKYYQVPTAIRDEINDMYWRVHRRGTTFTSHPSAGGHILAYLMKMNDASLNDWVGYTEAFRLHMIKGANVPVEQVDELIDLIAGHRLSTHGPGIRDELELSGAAVDYAGARRLLKAMGRIKTRAQAVAENKAYRESKAISDESAFAQVEDVRATADDGLAYANDQSLLDSTEGLTSALLKIPTGKLDTGMVDAVANLLVRVGTNWHGRSAAFEEMREGFANALRGRSLDERQLVYQRALDKLSDQVPNARERLAEIFGDEAGLRARRIQRAAAGVEAPDQVRLQGWQDRRVFQPTVKKRDIGPKPRLENYGDMSPAVARKEYHRAMAAWYKASRKADAEYKAAVEVEREAFTRNEPQPSSPAARRSRESGEIEYDPATLREKFEQKAWTKPTVEGVRPLPEDAFETLDDWLRFVVAHEEMHGEWKQGAKESKGAYENRINQKALASVKQNPDRFDIAPARTREAAIALDLPRTADDLPVYQAMTKQQDRLLDEALRDGPAATPVPTQAAAAIDSVGDLLGKTFTGKDLMFLARRRRGLSQARKGLTKGSDEWKAVTRKLADTARAEAWVKEALELARGSGPRARKRRKFADDVTRRKGHEVVAAIPEGRIAYYVEKPEFARVERVRDLQGMRADAVVDPGRVTNRQKAKIDYLLERLPDGRLRFDVIEQKVSDGIADQRGRRTTLLDMPHDAPEDGTFRLKVHQNDADEQAIVDAIVRAEGGDPSAYASVRSVMRWGLVKERETIRIADEALASSAVPGGGNYKDNFLNGRASRAAEEGPKLLHRYAFGPGYGKGPAELVDDVISRFNPQGDVAHAKARIDAVQDYVFERGIESLTGGIKRTDNDAMAKYLAQNRPAFTGMNKRSLSNWLKETGFWSPRAREEFERGVRDWTLDEQAAYHFKYYREVPWYANYEFLKNAGYFDDLKTHQRLARDAGEIDDEALAQARLAKADPDEQIHLALYGDESQGIAPRRSWRDERRFWKGLLGGKLTNADGTFKHMHWLMTADELRVNLPDELVKPHARAALMFDSVEELDKFKVIMRRVVDRMVKDGEIDFSKPITAPMITLMSDRAASLLIKDLSWLPFTVRGTIRGRVLNIWSHFARAITTTNVAFFGVNLGDTWLKGKVGTLLEPKAYWQGNWEAVRRHNIRSFADDIDYGAESQFGLDLRHKHRATHDATTIQGVVERGRAKLHQNRLLPSDHAPGQAVKGVAQAAGETLRDLSARSLTGVESAARDRVTQQAYAQLYDDSYRTVRKRFEKDKNRKANAGDEEMLDRAADRLTRLKVRNEVEYLFPSLRHASDTERFINSLIPFASYRVRNKLLWLGYIFDHPAWLNRLDMAGDALREYNENEWNKRHPNIPYEDNGMIKLWWTERPDGSVVQFDPTMLSDMGRGLSPIDGKDRSVNDLIYEWFAPMSPALIAGAHMITDALHLTGHLAWVYEYYQDANGQWIRGEGKQQWVGDGEPWSGKPASLGSLFWPLDLGKLFHELNEGGLDAQDLTRLVHKVLFYGDPRMISADQILNDSYWALRDAGEYDAAREFLRKNPRLRTYWRERGMMPKDWIAPSWLDPDYDADPPERLYGDEWLRNQPYHYRIKVGKAYGELREIRDSFQDRLDAAVRAGDLSLASDIRKERQKAVMEYYATHPELTRYETYSQSPQRWAERLQEWVVDDLTDGYFAFLDTRPKQQPGESLVAFRNRQTVWRAQNEYWKKTYPQVAERALGAIEGVRNARQWQDFVWEDAFRRQTDLRIDIERAKNREDWEAVDLAYTVKDLDNEIFENDTWARYDVGDLGRTSIKVGAVDLGDFGRILDRSRSPAEKAQAERDRWYASGMKDIISYAKGKSKNDPDSFGKYFVEKLRQNPELLKAYFAANPGKEAEWARNQEYINKIGRFARLLKNDRFDAAFEYFDSLPPWVKARYFENNPDSKMKDGVGGRGGGSSKYGNWWGKFHDLMDAGKRGQAFEMYNNMPNWVQNRYFKEHPAKRREFEQNEKYLGWWDRFHDLMNSGRKQAAFDYYDQMPGWVRKRYFASKPEKRREGYQTGQYAAHMQRWVKFFERNDVAGGMKYFRSMPQWIQDRYFKTHPGKKQSWAQAEQYTNHMGRWIKLIEGGNWDRSNAYFWSMPSWVRSRYFKTHPNSGMRKTRGGAFPSNGGGGGMDDKQFKQYGNYMGRWIELIEKGDWDTSNEFFWSLPKWVRDQYFKNNPKSGMRKTKPGQGGGQPPQFEPSGDDKAYIDAMGKWVEMYRTGNDADAEAYFRSLPAWMRNRYLAKHPDKAILGESLEMTGKIAEYFSGDEAHRAAYGAANPDVLKWVNSHSGQSQRLGILLAIYAKLPQDDWIRRSFREMYPEVFSAEARGERRAESKWEEAADMGMTDEMMKWMESLSNSAREAMKYSIKPPKPMQIERKRRRRKHSNTYSARDLSMVA
jgi:hypothetical protein